MFGSIFTTYHEAGHVVAALHYRGRGSVYVKDTTGEVRYETRSFYKGQTPEIVFSYAGAVAEAIAKAIHSTPRPGVHYADRGH